MQNKKFHFFPIQIGMPQMGSSHKNWIIIMQDKKFHFFPIQIGMPQMGSS